MEIIHEDESRVQRKNTVPLAARRSLLLFEQPTAMMERMETSVHEMCVRSNRQSGNKKPRWDSGVVTVNR
jgi:hypothetical protein